MEAAPRVNEIREIAAEPQKTLSEEPRPQREITIPEPEPEPAPVSEPSESSGKKVTKEELSEELKELKGTMKARFYTEDYGLIKELPVREVIKSLEETQGIHAIVFDGIITQRLVDLAENKGAKILVGERLGNVNKKPERIELITKSK
jgi:hypothetical protein